jgi:7-carboxy-7-deazaguanine synthase
MPKTLIEQKPTFDKKVAGEDKLAIAEMFGDTLQGEGVSVGVPSTFVRLQGCTLTCVWCDTLDVWPHGNEYSFDEIFQLFEENGFIEKFKNGQHLILTGGSPLKQQRKLVAFISQFVIKYGFKPYIEVENEAVLMPDSQFSSLVDQWNNSPKLANSGMKLRARVKPEVIKLMSVLPNSWFKFVIQTEAEWEEIVQDYFPHIKSIDQIILMPEGQTQEELSKTREIVADLAIKKGVKFTDRLHVTIWNKKTGV